MSNRKEQERAELHRTIWSMANDLRGSVDGWDFKQYVLGMLFYRYISENISACINEDEAEAGDVDFNYVELSDEKAESIRDELVNTKGFFILPSELFENVQKRASEDENLNVTLEKIFKNIEASAQGTASEANFRGLFDDLDVNSNKLGGTVIRRNERLVKLINSVADMRLGSYKDNTIDAFGDAYEFLMAMYASNAGKSGGEYFTPQEVSELLTRIALVGKTAVNKVYDPACGSGSLLLQSAKLLGKDNVRQGFFGQEINITTFNLCRINMFLHDVDFDKFDIAHGDTLTEPLHWDDEPFEVIVSNPPYSIKWAGDDDAVLINDPRFSPAGVLAPKSRADLAFIMHSLAWLATNGTAAIVCFPGVLYRGGAEQKIRKYLIDNNYIEAIIQLSDELFFGTSIATCIMVLRKGKTENNTLFIDASKEAVKVTNNKKLTADNISKILEIYKNKKELEYFSKLVPNEKIAEEEYNLSVSTYVQLEDTREKIDIKALNQEIREMVAKQEKLRKEIDEIVKQYEYYREKLLSFGDEVKWKTLGEATKISRGVRVVKSQLKETGLYPVFQNSMMPLGYYEQSNFKADTTFIISAGAAGEIGYSDIDFWAADDCFCFSCNDNLLNKFLYYFLLSQQFFILSQVRKASIPRLPRRAVETIKIPLPPLPVQEEIVRILDNFTELTAELTAELAARRKQYEYYREQLLIFPQLVSKED